MKALDRIFYIYTSASFSVFALVAALIEVLCGAAIGGDVQTYFANPAAGFFAIVAGFIWLDILRDERKYSH